MGGCGDQPWGTRPRTLAGQPPESGQGRAVHLGGRPVSGRMALLPAVAHGPRERGRHPLCYQRLSFLFYEKSCAVPFRTLRKCRLAEGSTRLPGIPASQDGVTVRCLPWPFGYAWDHAAVARAPPWACPWLDSPYCWARDPVCITQPCGHILSCPRMSLCEPCGHDCHGGLVFA